jgi:hypothetical protein
VCVDPLTVDAESPCDLGGVHEPDTVPNGLLGELGDALRDRLDVLAVKTPAPVTVRWRALAAPVGSGKMIMCCVAQWAVLA